MRYNKNDIAFVDDLKELIKLGASRRIFFERIDQYIYEEMEDEYYTLTDEAVKDIEKARQEFKEGKGVEFDFDEFVEELEDDLKELEDESD